MYSLLDSCFLILCHLCIKIRSLYLILSWLYQSNQLQTISQYCNQSNSGPGIRGVPYSLLKQKSDLLDRE